MKRFADIIIEKRLLFLSLIILLTLFFLYQAVTKLTVKTVFSDLLPKNHAYVNLHNEVRNMFGGANQAYILVKVRDKEDGGKYDDVFNNETLNIVRSISKDLLTFHAVDRYKILSLASNKIKNIKMTNWGMSIKSIMYPRVPKTKEGIEKIRSDVYSSPMAYPSLVSFDSKNTLITVDFFEDQIDYKISFKELKALREKYEDKNHIIAISGEPMHLGYIDSYIKDVLKILTYTVLAMMAMFFLYFRSKRGMIVPIIAAAISAVWGLGFLSLMNFNLDPLVLVFPFLIAAMAASHSVQVVKRYKEEAYLLGDNKKACKSVIEHLFIPGFAGIITDASGIIVIALTPIPILQKICLSCAFWAFATVLIAMILVPILLSYMPIKTAAPEGVGILDRILKKTGFWVAGKGKYPVLVVSFVLLIWGSFYVNDITIGNAVPGSEVLWPWHRYNVDSFRITFAMPMLNPLYVVVEGTDNMDIANATIIRDILKFIRHMRYTEDMRVIFPMSHLISIPRYHMMMRDNDFNRSFTPMDDAKLKALYRNIVEQAGPGTWDMYVDSSDMKANIIIYCRDKTSETIKIVIDRINDFIRNKSMFGKLQKDVERQGFDKFIYWVDGFFRKKDPPIPEKEIPEGVPRVYYRLAGGAVGIQAGINETLTLYQIWTFILALITVFFLCAFIFRSFFAGLIITVPLILSNVLAFSFMVLNNPPLPLTTATLPVASVGIGLGVDYGIYLVSRIIEEYKLHGNLNEAISTALGTTGKAIVYIATTLVCGIAFWFMSKLMFQALMGLLLAIILLLNMLGALLIIPSIIALFKPKFITGKIKPM